jgi:hypothetical protein
MRLGTDNRVAERNLLVLANRAQSFRVDGFIPAGRSRPIGNDSATPQHTRLPLAPQKAAEDGADPKSQYRAEAEDSYDEPPDQGQATVHGVGSPPALSRSYCLRNG